MSITVAEADREWAWNVGRDNSDREWILSDRDVWYRNPSYTGPKGHHPEDDNYWCQYDMEETELEALQRIMPEHEIDFMPG